MKLAAQSFGITLFFVLTVRGVWAAIDAGFIPSREMVYGIAILSLWWFIYAMMKFSGR